MTDVDGSLSKSSVLRQDFSARLLAWFMQYGRHDLPWQTPRTPYRVWVSEVMLQQTQVVTVIPYFIKFINKFPSLVNLAQASLDDVLASWAGLGYYARARHLHQTANICLQKYHGELPREFSDLVKLPGIGRSTAGAILAQAFGDRQVILDGNVKRILARYAGIHDEINRVATQKQLWELAEQYTPNKNLMHYTQAIMDLGAMICLPKKPLCGQCPLQKQCVAKKMQLTQILPNKIKIKKISTKKVIVLIIIDQSHRVLLQKRLASGIWGGLWSLPEVDCVEKIQPWITEKIEAKIIGYKDLPMLKHIFTHIRLNIYPLVAFVKIKNKHKFLSVTYDWFTREAMKKLGLPAPIYKILQQYVMQLLPED